jgi:ABC-type Mn2+/Zn2+ transport system permease subunit
MSHNVGGVERPIRVLLGLALLGIAYFHAVLGGVAIAAYVVGGILLLTGLAGYCPAWSVFRINTCATNHAKTGSSKPA